MKRIDTLSKEDIIKIMGDNPCTEFCAVYQNTGSCSHDISCMTGIMSWFNEEIKVKTVPRIALISTAEDLIKAREERSSDCRQGNCSSCKYYSRDINVSCYENWLLEEVEIKI